MRSINVTRLEEVFSLFGRLLERKSQSMLENFLIKLTYNPVSLYTFSFIQLCLLIVADHEKKIKALKKKRDQILKLIEEEKRGTKLEKNQVHTPRFISIFFSLFWPHNNWDCFLFFNLSDWQNKQLAIDRRWNRGIRKLKKSKNWKI